MKEGDTVTLRPGVVSRISRKVFDAEGLNGFIDRTPLPLNPDRRVTVVWLGVLEFVAAWPSAGFAPHRAYFGYRDVAS